MLHPLNPCVAALAAAALFALPAATQTIETVGGTTTTPTGALRGKGSLFQVDTTVLLLEYEMQLNVPSADTVTFFCYRHHSRTGTANLIWTLPVPVAGGIGTAWYSTGPIALPLLEGGYYTLGAFWNGSTTYYYSTASAGAPVSFGNWQRAFTVTGSLPPTLNYLSGTDTAQYFQRLTTLAVDSVDLVGVGCSTSTAAPRLVADAQFQLGDTSRLELVSSSPNALGVFALAAGPLSPVSLPVLGCELWLDLGIPYATAPALTDASGYAALPLAVPATPSLSGSTFASQALVFGSTLDMSNALQFLVQ